MSALSSSQLKELREFDTPTICNAIELFDVRPRTSGYINSSIRSCFPEMPPLVGYALTSTFRAQQAPPAGSSYAGIDGQLKAFEALPGPPVIIFQDLDAPSVAATFGEVMCTTYQNFGAVGLITSGTGRDLDQVRAIGFPVFTSGTCCSHGYCHIMDVGVEVSVGGTTIHQGTLIHGDCNGVTTIPLDIASEIAQVCRELILAEKIVLDYVRTSDKSPEGFTKARMAMADQFSAIRKRVSRAASDA
ncbi:MAG: RraA family protein [Planctomycetaceae bacterium]|nr:RraA family protein [Planctomycetaceae bacterium]